MKALSPKEFEARWQKAKTGPAMVKASIKCVKPEVTMTAVLDRFMLMIDDAVAEHMVEPALQTEIQEAAANLRKVLAKVPEKKLIQMRRKRKAT